MVGAAPRTAQERGGLRRVPYPSARWKPRRRCGVPMSDVGEAPSSRSVTLRAVAVLGAFDADHRCLNLSHLSRRSGLPLATVHRLAADLVAGRLLVRREDGRYEIGARLWQ